MSATHPPRMAATAGWSPIRPRVQGDLQSWKSGSPAIHGPMGHLVVSVLRPEIGRRSSCLRVFRPERSSIQSQKPGTRSQVRHRPRLLLVIPCFKIDPLWPETNHDERSQGSLWEREDICPVAGLHRRRVCLHVGIAIVVVFAFKRMSRARQKIVELFPLVVCGRWVRTPVPPWAWHPRARMGRSGFRAAVAGTCLRWRRPALHIVAEVMGAHAARSGSGVRGEASGAPRASGVRRMHEGSLCSARIEARATPGQGPNSAQAEVAPGALCELCSAREQRRRSLSSQPRIPRCAPSAPAGRQVCMSSAGRHLAKRAASCMPKAGFRETWPNVDLHAHREGAHGDIHEEGNLNGPLRQKFPRN